MIKKIFVIDYLLSFVTNVKSLKLIKKNYRYIRYYIFYFCLLYSVFYTMDMNNLSLCCSFVCLTFLIQRCFHIDASSEPTGFYPLH